MRNIGFLSVIIFALASCAGSSNGELVGVQDRAMNYSAPPTGMVMIEKGSYRMGQNSQDVPWANTSQAKNVSIGAFWMDETEVTNNEYRQFVHWVRDSLAYRMLGEQIDEYLISEDAYGNQIDPPYINWEIEILWDGEEENEILQDLYYAEHERFYRQKAIDPRKLNYEYYWIDYRQAAMKHTFENENRRHYNYKTGQYDGEIVGLDGKNIPIKDRSSFIMRDVINVYPDTLCWISDFSYSYNEPMADKYFWHVAFDNYPVVGVTWKQATAFSIWRTNYMNSYLSSMGDFHVQDYRLPMESEWEYAARGGNDLAVYPWGGPYTRNDAGCFLANFKPVRGDYVDDGGLNTVEVAAYDPNDFGLYDMAGNVSEWTANAYDESAYSFTHDMNPYYLYNALPDDPPALKRKVIRGGSWKDIAYYMQNATRTYEYQDTAKAYIGFRCVRSYMGPDENGAKSAVY